MALESMMLYSCPVCGNTLIGMEWEDHPNKTVESFKEYCCPSCDRGLNEDELIGED